MSGQQIIRSIYLFIFHGSCLLPNVIKLLVHLYHFKNVVRFREIERCLYRVQKLYIGRGCVPIRKHVYTTFS